MRTVCFSKIFLALLFTAFRLPALTFAAETLKYTDHEPLHERMRTQFIKEVFFTAVERESSGRLKIEDHWDGEIAKSYDALRAVTHDSLADMAIVVPEYVPNELPLHQIFKSFPIGPTGDQQVAFFRRVYEEVPAFTAELDKANVVAILVATGFPLAFFSTRSMNSLEEMQGERWRTASFWHQYFLRNTGAVPVSMPWGEEVHAALREGKLDGLVVNVDSGYHVKAHEGAPNVLTSKELWLGHVYLLVMNKNRWDRLPQEDKDAIERAALAAYRSLGSIMDESFCSQLEELKKEGAVIRVLERQEVEDWQNATKYQDVQNAWAREQEEKGVKDVVATLEKVRLLLEQ